MRRRRRQTPTANSEDRLDTPEAKVAFEEEMFLSRVDDAIERLVEKRGLKQQELAERMGVTEGRVSQILSGRENMTLRTLARLAWALDSRLKIQEEPIGPYDMDDEKDFAWTPIRVGEVQVRKQPTPVKSRATIKSKA